MTTKGSSLTLALLLAVVASCLMVGCRDEPAAEGPRVRIVATGILQGCMAPFERHYSRGRVRRFGDPARVAAVVESLRTEAVDGGRTCFVVDVGDDLSGSAEALFSRGAVIARFLGDLRLDAALPGNLEFTHGVETLTALARDRSLPYVAANLSAEGGGPLPFVRPWVVLDAGGATLLVSGLTPPNLKYVCLPADTAGVAVDADMAAPLRRVGAEKRRVGAAAALVLTQESLGTEVAALQTALTSSGVDLVVGLDFDRDADPLRLGDALALPFPGQNQGQRVLVLDFRLPPGGGVADLTSFFAMVDADEVAPRPDVAAYLDEARRTWAAELDREVARAEAFMAREFVTDGDTGNLVADALRQTAGADVAVINSGGVASGLAPGPILVRDLYRVIPYQNRTVTLQVTGATLRTFLERTLERGSPLQVSGLELTMRRRSGGGYTLVSVTRDGSTVPPEGTFRVATNDFVLGRSPFLVPVGEPVTGPLVRDVVRDWLASHSPVARPPRGRVTLEGE